MNPSFADASAGAPSSPPAVLVTGATGFVGRALVAALRLEGCSLMVLSRDARRARRILGADLQVVERLDAIAPDARIDAIVHLAGARVLGMPWTAGRRRTLLHSRVDVTAALVAMVQRLQRRPRVLVGASAVGFYGAPPAPSAPLDETGPSRPGEFQSDLCVAIEQAALRAEVLGVRVVCLRFGVVLGASGGAYPMQALPARLGLGAILGGGEQPAPWLHLDDAVGLLQFAIAQEGLRGPVNAVAPDTPTQARFVRALAASLGRPVWLRMPAAPLRLLAGEMATLLLDGQQVVPRVLQAAGYGFSHPQLEEALRALARGAGTPR